MILKGARRRRATCAVLMYEGQHMAAAIDNGNVVRDPKACGFRLGRRQHALRIVRCEARTGSGHVIPVGSVILPT
jgi:hypothetical protein